MALGGARPDLPGGDLGDRLRVEGYRPIGDRPLLSYSATLLGVGTQLVCLGILAEMVTAYNIREADTFSVAETPGIRSAERSPFDGIVRNSSPSKEPRRWTRTLDPEPARRPAAVRGPDRDRRRRPRSRWGRPCGCRRSSRPTTSRGIARSGRSWSAGPTRSTIARGRRTPRTRSRRPTRSRRKSPAPEHFYSSKPPLFATLMAGVIYPFRKLAGVPLDARSSRAGRTERREAGPGRAGQDRVRQGDPAAGDLAGVHPLFQAGDRPVQRRPFPSLPGLLRRGCSTATPPTTGPGSWPWSRGVRELTWSSSTRA